MIEQVSKLDYSKRVYVAGAYSATNVIAMLNNMREGMRLATQVMLLGYAPFCPWLDHHFQFMLQKGETLTVADYKKYSFAWLDVSHAIILVPSWEKSEGTIDEIKRASEISIPVFYDLMELRTNL